jgi:hypothetical protein
MSRRFVLAVGLVLAVATARADESKDKPPLDHYLGPLPAGAVERLGISARCPL